MNRRTIDYGIDLGTTNSSIARMVDGVPVIIKNDQQKDTTPSCVYVSRAGQLCVGDEAIRRYKRDAAKGIDSRAQMEFKTRLGTDTVYTFGEDSRAWTPETLSAEILRALGGYVRDETLDAAVISVPAAFSQVQIEATQKAATLAGLRTVELVPEPLAASIMFGVQTRKAAGHWLVFDLGGGTFDAVLMRMPDGLMQVVDITGDNRLGGKDIDYLIVDRLILPELARRFGIRSTLADPARRTRVRELLKWLYAEDAKIALSSRESVMVEIDEGLTEDDSGAPLESFCIEITRAQLCTLVAPMVDRAIALSSELLTRNHLGPDDLSTILLIGGPTCMPFVRESVRERLCARAQWHVDPMTAVACGAALHASTRERPRSARPAVVGQARVVLTYAETTVESTVSLAVQVESDRATGARIQVSRGDHGWSSDSIELNESAVLLTLSLAPDCVNVFDIALCAADNSRIECDISRFTILQGIRIDDPPLPFDICLEAGTEAGDRLVPVLRKGMSLPATGVARSLRTRCDIHAGNARDTLVVPVYEGEAGTRALYNRCVGELRITGAMVSQDVPSGTSVEVTITIDTSRRKTVSVFFPRIDETCEEAMPPLQKTRIEPSHIKNFFTQAGDRIERFERNLRGETLLSLEPLSVAFSVAECLLEADPDAALDRVREIHRDLDLFETEKKGTIAIAGFADEFDYIARYVDSHGTAEDRAELRSIREPFEAAVAEMNESACEQRVLKARSVYWRIVNHSPDYWLGALYYNLREFDTYQWRGRDRARELLENAKKLCANGYCQELNAIIREVWKLRLDDDNETGRGDILECVR